MQAGHDADGSREAGGTRSGMGSGRPTQTTWLPIGLGILVVVIFTVNLSLVFEYFDDAFISFRYSRHLVDGLGLVWNPGERVEGYTNLLWVLIVAAGMLAGIAPETLTPILGTLSALMVLALLAYLAARRQGWTSPLIWLAPGTLALSRSYVVWSGSGLETHFFCLLVLGGFVLLVRERDLGAEFPWLSSLCLAFATLTRPEGGLFMFSAGLCFLADVLSRRRRLRSLLIWSLPFLVLVGVHLLWRLSYYHFWLPNTFYAKVNGLWWDQSAVYLWHFFADYHLVWFVPLILVSVLGRRDFLSTLFFVPVVLYFSYIASIGGGHLEYRLLVPVFPLMYWLIADGIQFLAVRHGRQTWMRSSAVGFAGAISLALLATTLYGSLHPLDKSDANGIGSTGTYYAATRMTQGKALRRLIERGILPSDLRIETGACGALPYYTDWYVLDKRGLNDVRVAHQTLTSRGAIGHEHEATLAYVREREIAVLLLGHELLHDVDFRGLQVELAKARHWMNIYNQQARTAQEQLRLRCLQVDQGTYLIFGTNLDEDQFRQTLGHLRRCSRAEAY
jgi:arabinofuranosyltransferase